MMRRRLARRRTPPTEKVRRLVACGVLALLSPEERLGISGLLVIALIYRADMPFLCLTLLVVRVTYDSVSYLAFSCAQFLSYFLFCRTFAAEANAASQGAGVVAEDNVTTLLEAFPKVS